MGSGQLSQVMQSVSRSVLPPLNIVQSYPCARVTLHRDPSQHASLKAEIEAQSSSLFATARLWDDGIIKPTETRDVVGLGLALAARQRGSIRPSHSSGWSGITWDGEGRGFGVYRM
jgi:3-methylcrotonyl-CoA carboxylase beta subunit